MQKSFKFGWIFGAVLLLAGSAWADTFLVGDIEGRMEHLKTLEDRGAVKIANGQLRTSNPNDTVLTVGDMMRRGPYGTQIVHMFIEAREHSNGIVNMIGNHDVNGLSAVILAMAIDEGLVPEYDQWAEANVPSQQRHWESSKLWWWMNKYGLSDKVFNFWIGAAVTKSGQPASAFYTNGKVDVKKLEAVVSAEENARSFLQFHSPGGDGFKFLEGAYPIKTLDGGRVMVLHSGQPTKANFGKISGSHYIDIKSRADLLKWEADYLDFRDSHLKTIADLTKEYTGLKEQLAAVSQDDTASAASIKNGMKTAAQNLLDDRFRIWGDAGWDHSKGDVAIDADSPIYPDKRVFSDTSLPGVPDQETLHRLALAGVEVVPGGHFPVGDGPVARIGIDHKTGHRVLFLTLDTSFSPVEGQAFMRIDKDGTILVDAKNRIGQKFVLEYPSGAKLQEMQASTDPKIQEKAKALARYGYAVDGYVIIGNLVEIVNGEEVIQYDKFMLVRQDGHTFSYKTVDIWGILDAEKLGKYGVPEVDMTALHKNAKEKQKETLKALNKNDLSAQQFYNAVKGKSWHLISGPSMSSFEPLRKSQPDEVAAYLRDFETRIRSYGPKEEVVFLGGGTLGLESELTQIINRVGAERVSKGQKGFNIIGFPTGVTADKDFDPSVKNYYRLNAFYWDDYMAELMELLGKVNKKSPPARFTAEFAGGGGILPLQILRDTLPRIRDYKNFKLVLNKGLNQIDKVKGLVLSGTDKSINAIKERNDPDLLARIEVRDETVRRSAVTAVKLVDHNPHATAKTIPRVRCVDIFRH